MQIKKRIKKRTEKNIIRNYSQKIYFAAHDRTKGSKSFSRQASRVESEGKGGER